MKSKILIALALISFTVFYSFDKKISNERKTTSIITNISPQNKFILGAMHDSRDSVYTYLVDTLKFNIWHKYTVPRGWGWPIINSNNVLASDVLDTPVYRYSSDIRQRISLNNSKN